MTSRQYSMIDVAPTVSALLRLPPPAQAKGAPIREIIADFGDIRRVAILAPDALGDFAWRLWRARMPFLESLHLRRSLVLCSVMPSITPVNFAAMVTGTDRAGHGVGTFKDNFACETLFDVVRKVGGRSAGIGLQGYSGNELLGRFADIRADAGKESDDDVADKIVEISKQHHPEFLIAQLGKVDDVFHKYGPSSPSVAPMLAATDERLKRLVGHLKPLGYAILILSDHGQHDVAGTGNEAKKGSHGTDTPEDRLVPCTWT